MLLIVERRWFPEPRDAQRMWEHLMRQHGLDARTHVRLDDGRVVPVGQDAEGET